MNKNHFIFTLIILLILSCNKTKDSSNEIIQSIHASLDIKDYHLKELHEFVMLLDERYYDPFPKWIEVPV